MLKFLKQTKKIMKQMAEIHYLSTALCEPWNSLLRKTTEPQFADFKQLQFRLQNRTDEVAWNLKFDSPDARKLADDFMGECNLHYQDNKDVRTGKSFLERMSLSLCGTNRLLHILGTRQSDPKFESLRYTYSS